MAITRWPFGGTTSATRLAENSTVMATATAVATASLHPAGYSATAMATATWTGWTATSSGPRSGRASATRAICGTSTSTGTATWTGWTTGNSAAGSASIDQLRRAAGGALTAKQAPHRPGTAPALGLRAERAGVILRRPSQATTTTSP